MGESGVGSREWGNTVAQKPPLMLVGLAIAIAIAVLMPLTYLVIRTAGVGEEKLLTLVSRPRTLQVLLNSAILAIATPILTAAIAVPLAFLTWRTDLPWRRFWLVATTLPLAVPDYVCSFALIAAFGPKGSWLQLLLEPLGIQELPQIYGWGGTLLALTLLTYPYMLLGIWAGLQGIHPAQEEAARSLGYSQFKAFWRVTLPQLRPSLLAGGAIVAMYALQDFGATTVMRFDAFTRAIYILYRYTFDRHQAATLALMLAVLVLLLLWLEAQARSRAAYYSQATTYHHSHPVVHLRVWKLPALIFCCVVVSLGLILPLAVTLFWLGRGWLGSGLSEVASLQKLLELAWHSIFAAGLAAVVATACALPVAVLSVRFPNRLTTAIERCTYIGFGLPGIVVALSLVFWGANYLPWLYQTLPMLVFAYLVMFLSQSVGTVRSSLLQITPQLEESARSLGKNPWQTFTAITFPLLRPGVLSGALLVFLTAIKELPTTLLLAPIGFNTLAVHIWKATENVSYSDAAAASLVMLVVSIGSTLLLLSQTSWRELITENPILIKEVD
ncbi:iron ABC transporter permease [cyanobacterium TDX16]|nr:iron ABC transporter permease [cyanobacterium TDX16]